MTTTPPMRRRNSIPPVRMAALLLAFAILPAPSQAAPRLLDDQFDMPPGFHIYRAATPEQSGGSYELAIDGSGRVLVGDGETVRRLSDPDGDGVFDSFDALAGGLGWRGPQGLLIYGDRLYAVGGDGVQLYDGYLSGELSHRGRIGARFNTGGDHDAHSLLRGHDGWIYLVVGDGAGHKARSHITGEHSPVLRARAGSVFRFSPDGTRWECVSNGGRNAPNLGMNALGDLFSFDSDMEWHVGLPWYRPCRLNHWIAGADLGWQENDAFPPHFFDTIPGVVDVGRGSPTGGVFYEHNQFPARLAGAYIVCDYRWKGEATDRYRTGGRLVAFHIQPQGAGYRASMEVLVRPKPGARDADGRPIGFALVDCEVAPDGSLLVTDHNQGIWRVFYALPPAPAQPIQIPPLTPPWPPLATSRTALVDQLLSCPQPAAERSRLREDALKRALGPKWRDDIQQVAARPDATPDARLRAIRLLTPDAATLPGAFVQSLCSDPAPAVRQASARWLAANTNLNPAPILNRLLADPDAAVQRRAAEIASATPLPSPPDQLSALIDNENPFVNQAAVAALAHWPAATWLDDRTRPRSTLHQMFEVLALLKRDGSVDPTLVRQVVARIDSELHHPPSGQPAAAAPVVRRLRLNLLRFASLFETAIKTDPESVAVIRNQIRQSFPDPDRAVFWEQVRVIGLYSFSETLPALTRELQRQPEPVTQFHLAQALSRLPRGGAPEDEQRALEWVLSTQSGWFATFADKGVEFEGVWSTILSDFATRHREALLASAGRIDLASPLGGAFIEQLARDGDAGPRLIALYRQQSRSEARTRIARALGSCRTDSVAMFLREAADSAGDGPLRQALLQALASQNPDPANAPLLRAGLKSEDVETARASCVALAAARQPMDEDLATTLVSLLGARRGMLRGAERVLAAGSGTQRDGYNPAAALDLSADESERTAIIEFWKGWYRRQFGKDYSNLAHMGPERNDEALFEFIVSPRSAGGSPARGGTVYERLQCHTCHGGGANPGREGRFFGPDLAGVTRRLTRQQLAEAIVYPSRQVADRFKPIEVELNDGTTLTGFVTGRNDRSLTLATTTDIRRIPNSEVKSLQPQNRSLMPERLLASLPDDDIRNLIAYLDNLGSPGGLPSP